MRSKMLTILLSSWRKEINDCNYRIIDPPEDLNIPLPSETSAGRFSINTWRCIDIATTCHTGRLTRSDDISLQKQRGT